MRASTALASPQLQARSLVLGLALLGCLLAAPRAEACGACAVPELWDVQDLGGELVLVTNFGLLAEHGDGWRVTCEEVFGGLLLAARGNSSEGWVSTDIGPFRRTGSACEWTPGPLPEHASWAWKFALARGEAGGTTTRFMLVIDSETQALHVERARADEDFRVVHSFDRTSGFRDLAAGGEPASVFVAGFGAGTDRLWQVAFSVDAGESWETVVPDAPLETKWVLRFVDPLFPQAVLVESESVSDGAQGVWRFDAATGVMTELLSLSDGEALAGLTVLGESLWVAGRAEAGGSLYRAERAALAFSRVVTGAPPFACLAAHAGALYACVNDFTYTSDFLLGRSDDEGRSWQASLTVEDLGLVEGCGSACDRTLEWLDAAFGAAGAPGSSTAGGQAGAEGSLPQATRRSSGCGCRLGGLAPPGGALLVVGLGLGALWRRRSRKPKKLGMRRPLVVLTVATLAACSGDPPEARPGAADCGGRGDDLDTLRLTSGSLVLSVLETWPEPPGVGDNEWLVLVSDPSDEPVTGLAESLEITAFMPEHGHGTPTAVGVTESDAGQYRLAPVNTFMPGLWRIRLAVDRADPEFFEFSVCGMSNERMLNSARCRLGALLLGALLNACGDQDARLTPSLTREALLDPRTCQSCHPGHYEEWSGSMHAYSAEDPVFLAMNARGQAETNGQLGSFCVDCHAPLAVREGLTQDGLDLAEVPKELRGVTCYFCHNTVAVEGTHNNPLVLANDRTMRGAFGDAAPNSAHAAAYAPHFDSARPEASALCGACHDVTLPEHFAGTEVALERTFVEWKTSLFAAPHEQGGVGCSGCHMPKSPRRERAAETAGAPRRSSARHDFEGIDLALTPFPQRERQQILVERLVSSSLLAEICVAETGALQVTLENAGSGHHWPSGASHNRQAWLEVRAFVDGQAEAVFESPPPTEEAGQALVLKDHVVDREGNPAHMFWDIAEVAVSSTLPSAKTRDSRDPDFHRERRVFLLNEQPSSLQPIERVTLTVRVRPIALEVLDDLVDSGHLDRDIADAVPVIDVLPDRCYEASLVEKHPDLLGARSVCEAASDENYTLVWEASRANESEPSFRSARVDGAPARCLSHPSYVAVPVVP